MTMTAASRISPSPLAPPSPKDPQALFHEKLAAYITRHLRADRPTPMPSALRRLATKPGVGFDSSLLLPSKGVVKGVKQPSLAIIDMSTGPNSDLVLHHPRKPNEGYVLLAGAIASQSPLAFTDAIDISTPVIAALKDKLCGDAGFNAALARAGFSFSDVKFVVGDVIGKKEGADFVGEFTDAGVGRYGAYVPGPKGKPLFAKNFLVASNVVVETDAKAKPVLKADIGSIKEEAR